AITPGPVHYRRTSRNPQWSCHRCVVPPASTRSAPAHPTASPTKTARHPQQNSPQPTNHHQNQTHNHQNCNHPAPSHPDQAPTPCRCCHHPNPPTTAPPSNYAQQSPQTPALYHTVHHTKDAPIPVSPKRDKSNHHANPLQ